MRIAMALPMHHDPATSDALLAMTTTASLGIATLAAIALVVLGVRALRSRHR